MKTFEEYLEEYENQLKKSFTNKETIHWVKTVCAGAISGAVGAFTVFPYDTIKTRLQTQPTNPGNIDPKFIYKSQFDCISKILKYEGFLKLYKGVTVVATMTSPEKALKLGINDYFRNYFGDPNTGKIQLKHEFIAAALAGSGQQLLTTPIEMIKIRLQMDTMKRLMYQMEHSKLPEEPPLTAIRVIKSLGFPGIYRGISVALMRDIPFSIIYFPLYYNWKRYLIEQHSHKSPIGEIEPWKVLMCSTVSAMIGAGLVTPADVIKTRIQGPDGLKYSGIVDCYKKCVAGEKGKMALWKGFIPRVFTRGPLFGIVFITYEYLKDLFGIDTKH